MTTAVLSMLHEPPDRHSAVRNFRGRAVLDWTIRRLRRSTAVDRVAVPCWDDQAHAVRAAGGDAVVVGERQEVASMQSIAAARRWAEGWRGGLLSTTEFDLGFHAPTLLRLDGSIVIVDPSAALLDAAIVDQAIARADEVNAEFAFAPAAPGFCAALLTRPVVERLAKAGVSPGVLFTYRPEAPLRDPLGSPGCASPPLAVARSTGRFKIDSDFQAKRFEHLLDGVGDEELLALSAEEIVRRDAPMPIDPLPRDVTVELTTRRQCRPIFSILSHRRIERANLTLNLAQALYSELAQRDDVRITFAGVGDPLLHPSLSQVVTIARDAGIRAIHVETDLLTDASSVEMLAELPIDVVSVHLPALTRPTYSAVMNTDGLDLAMANLQRLLARRNALGRGTPVVAPTFVKTRHNLAEMEPWYDAWVRAVGGAVVTYPTDFAGLLDDCSVGDMSPPQRVPCRRIASRLTVLADGTIVSCEEDPAARRPMGQTGNAPLKVIWTEEFGALRAMHADRRWGDCAVCSKCREWNRP